MRTSERSVLVCPCSVLPCHGLQRGQSKAVVRRARERSLLSPAAARTSKDFRASLSSWLAAVAARKPIEPLDADMAGPCARRAEAVRCTCQSLSRTLDAPHTSWVEVRPHVRLEPRPAP